jgi:hypothetical protein
VDQLDTVLGDIKEKKFVRGKVQEEILKKYTGGEVSELN